MKRDIAELRPAIRFFADNAGWATPPGKMACALHLAEAERDAKLLGYSWEWVTDDEGCSGCQCGDKRCDCASGREHETLGCILRDEAGKVLESLWGICGATAEYRRVVEAELALEAMRLSDLPPGVSPLNPHINPPDAEAAGQPLGEPWLALATAVHHVVQSWDWQDRKLDDAREGLPPQERNADQEQAENEWLWQTRSVRIKELVKHYTKNFTI